MCRATPAFLCGLFPPPWPPDACASAVTGRTPQATSSASLSLPEAALKTHEYSGLQTRAWPREVRRRFNLLFQKYPERSLPLPLHCKTNHVTPRPLFAHATLLGTLSATSPLGYHLHASHPFPPQLRSHSPRAASCLSRPWSFPALTPRACECRPSQGPSV